MDRKWLLPGKGGHPAGHEWDGVGDMMLADRQENRLLFHEVPDNMHLTTNKSTQKTHPQSSTSLCYLTEKLEYFSAVNVLDWNV